MLKDSPACLLTNIPEDPCGVTLKTKPKVLVKERIAVSLLVSLPCEVPII